MTVVMHTVKCKELTVRLECGLARMRRERLVSVHDGLQMDRPSQPKWHRCPGLVATVTVVIRLAAQVRDRYHGEKASVKTEWDIQQTIPPRSMNAS
jgi:hypothetical protein